MGNGGSRSEEPPMALPQQQVVSMGGRSHIGAAPAGAAVAAAQHHKSVQVRNPLIWDKNSFSVQRAGSSRFVWELSCEFAAEKPCDLAVHFHCREKLEEQAKCLEYAPADAAAPPALSVSFPEGRHTFRLEGETVIDLKKWPLEVFWKMTRKAPDIIPIAMSLRSGNVQSVVHLALQVPPRVAGGEAPELVCNVARQKVCIDGHEYVLQEVYGLEALAEHDAGDESAVGQPCVICLTDPRNTAVLPCRHLCVCEDCAMQLQLGAATRNDKCPICRSAITGMKVFEVQKSSQANS